MTTDTTKPPLLPASESRAAAPSEALAKRPAPAAAKPAAGRGEPRKQRIRRREGEQDPFYIPPGAIPDGYEAQWNVLEVLGQPVPAYDRVRMQEGGWEPVRVDQLSPEARARLLPAGHSGENVIVGGQILEIRPKYLGDEARADDRERAVLQRRSKLQQLALADTSAMPSRVNKLSIERQREIPE